MLTKLALNLFTIELQFSPATTTDVDKQLVYGNEIPRIVTGVTGVVGQGVDVVGRLLAGKQM